jgi:hypothetical protein
MATAKKQPTNEINGDEKVHSELPEVTHNYLQERIAEDAFYSEKRAKDEQKRKDDGHRLLMDLSEPFPPEVERELRKGGTALTYIPVSEVIARLNRCFGIAGWSSEIIRCERDPLDPDFIVAHVRLSTHGGDGWMAVTKDGFGGQKIKRTKAGEIVDLGDEFKGAFSDALKKAAQQFGVALYLARSDEALSIEIEQDMAQSRPQVDPKVAALWEQFRTLSGSFNAEQKAQLGQFWNEYANGAPKPTLETATLQILMALIEECTRISFPGSQIIVEE